MRFLYGALIGSLLATIFWLSAVCANQWVYWEIPVGGIFLPGTTTLLEAQHAGMWQSCRKVRFHEGNVTTKFKYCQAYDFYPSKEEIEENVELDYTVLNFRRAVTALAIIGLIVMVSAIAFTWYSIVQPRYIFKRLAGCLQIGCAGGILVCVELFQGMLNHEKSHLPAVYPPNTNHVLGFCYGIAWLCFAIFLVAGIILFVNSHKRKEKRPEDNPIIIGRI